MLLNNNACIYENNSQLKESIHNLASNCGVLSKHFIFINLSFSDEDEATPLNSGIKTALKLRAEQQVKSPILLYGYDSKESIRRRSLNIWFDDPLIKYIQMPFAFSEFCDLVIALNELVISSKNKSDLKNEGLLEYEKAVAINSLRILRHDILNAIRNLESVYLLTWNVNDQDKAQNRRSVEQTILLSKDTILNIEKEFRANYNKLSSILSSDILACIITNLNVSDKKFGYFRNDLITSSDADQAKLIKKAEEIIDLLTEISTILGETVHG